MNRDPIHKSKVTLNKLEGRVLPGLLIRAPLATGTQLKLQDNMQELYSVVKFWVISYATAYNPCNVFVGGTAKPTVNQSDLQVAVQSFLTLEASPGRLIPLGSDAQILLAQGKESLGVSLWRSPSLQSCGHNCPFHGCLSFFSLKAYA